MASTLLTSWGEYDSAVVSVLEYAERDIAIFDRDLQRLPLERAAVAELLATFLSSQPGNRLQIVVQDPGPLLRNAPRLLRLLTTHGHAFTITATPEHLANLNDSMVLVDGRHAAVRFHHAQARGKWLRNDPEAVSPYVKRFADILAEGGSSVRPGVPGL